MKKRWPLIVGVLVALAVVGFLVSRWLKPEEVLAYEIKREDVVATLTVTGEIRADRFANVSTPVSARIVQMFVDHGDIVKKGQTLVELDRDDALARVQQAQAALQFVKQGTRAETIARYEAATREARAQLNQSRAALASAQSQLAEARNDARRFESLYKDDIVSAQEYEQVKTKYDVAQQDVSRLQADIQASKTRVTQSEQQLNEARNGPTPAEINEARAALGIQQASLADHYIKSNLNGVVLSRTAEPGEMAQPGMTLLKIADRSTLEVVAFVEEVDLPRIHTGDVAHVILDALPDNDFTGRIIRIGSEVNPDNGTVEVEIQLTEVPEAVKLLPGMTADINIITDELKDATVVPSSAVGKEEGEYVVYVFNGSKLKQQVVKAERISLEYYRVSGLEPGTKIARYATEELLGKKKATPKLTELESRKQVSEQPASLKTQQGQ